MLLYSKVNQLYKNLYPLFFGFPSHLCHHRALSKQFPVLYSRSSLVIYFIHSINSVCVVFIAKSYLTLFHPVDCSAPGFSVHRISQARIVEWVAISFSRRSRPRNGTPISFTGWQILYHMSHQGSLTNSVYMSIPISAFIPNSP